MSADSVARRLAEGLAADFDASADLPAHMTLAGRRPRAILPEDCPVLVVWLDRKATSPESTERFDGQLVLGASWHEQAVEEAKTLVDNPGLSWSLLGAIERIEGRVRALARTGLATVPEAWQIIPGDTQYVGPLPQQGLVEGYALEIVAAVTEA
jgi:hypothetical protein